MKQTKEEFITGMLDGTLNYYQVSHENIIIKLEDNKGNLIGQSWVKAAVFGGGKKQLAS